MSVLIRDKHHAAKRRRGETSVADAAGGRIERAVDRIEQCAAAAEQPLLEGEIEDVLVVVRALPQRAITVGIDLLRRDGDRAADGVAFRERCL